MHACRQCAALLLRCVTLVVAKAGSWMDGDESEGGKRLDMQLEEQGQVQVISTHVRFPDASAEPSRTS